MKDQKTIDSLKSLIRKQISEVKADKPKSMYQTAAEITKTAAAGIAAVQALKTKVQMPSAKAMEAIDAHVQALEKILHDCLATPLAYLDVTPEEVVGQRRNDLDARAASLEPGNSPKKEEPALVDHALQENQGRCNCENTVCKHPPAGCQTPAGSRKAMYIGAICDGCAAVMPAEYMQENSSAVPVKQTTRPLSSPTSCRVCGSSYDKTIHPDCPTCAEAEENASVQQWIDKLRKIKK